MSSKQTSTCQGICGGKKATKQVRAQRLSLFVLTGFAARLRRQAPVHTRRLR